MEKHQVLKPRRARGTPFWKFYCKASLVVCTASLAIAAAYNWTYGEVGTKTIESGLMQDSKYIRQKKFLLSFMLIHPLKNPDALYEEYTDNERQFVMVDSEPPPLLTNDFE